ncbi:MULTISPECIES: nuclear transport factor 2 family protein [Streptomyces]|uniref:nuclear transport factor 2 family protein n=1 Tax=Streptomyces TaxID=1883 RepID=UPI00163CFA14|nr:MULTISPECIES: nuclear transport factor 2 family protein [Streptomyces]MBC2879460.1 nuclear transport factor 2 family protein [Streptomyces sp. TYQ1024]UBI39858.1 nuclear transport factor 2 family protein [Streptomyces mobaraensis]UKW32439.1 nuclear transport factor 2 family protein [Streptomyces sp. TYQ1024]
MAREDPAPENPAREDLAPEDPAAATYRRTGGLTVRESDADLRRAGLTREPEPWEDGLRETPRPGTFEWWYFDAECDDGSRAVVVFETKPLAASAGPLAPRLSLTVRTPDGRVHAGRTRHDPASFHAARDHCDVALGPHRAHGDLVRYRIRAGTPSAAADLTLTSTAPPSRVGTGTVTLADDPGRYLGWLVAVPRGTVEGRLSVPGRTWQVRGTGYHDKNWGTLDFGADLRAWHWARLHAGPFTLACAELRTPGGGRTPLLVLTRATERLAATATGVSFTPHPGVSLIRHSGHADIRWHDRVHALLGPPTALDPPGKPGPHPYHRFTTPAELTTTAPYAPTTTPGTAIAEHAEFSITPDRAAPGQPASAARAVRAPVAPPNRTRAGPRTPATAPDTPPTPAAPPERHAATKPADPATPRTPTGRTPGTHTKVPAMDARTAATRLARAWSVPDSAAFGALFAPDAVYTDVAAGRAHRGRTAITAWHRETRAATPDLTAEIEDGFGTDDGRACATLLWTGTPVAEPPGPPFRVHAATVLALAPDGSITRCADYYDLLGLARAGQPLMPQRPPDTRG